MAMMKKLKIAKFGFNEIAGFDGIGIWKQLPSLEEMELNNNKITGFVGDWGDIPNLVMLDACKCREKANGTAVLERRTSHSPVALLRCYS